VWRWQSGGAALHQLVRVRVLCSYMWVCLFVCVVYVVDLCAGVCRDVCCGCLQGGGVVGEGGACKRWVERMCVRMLLCLFVCLLVCVCV
jgi:hypothetical protein